jgi:hypothetical protein
MIEPRFVDTTCVKCKGPIVALPDEEDPVCVRCGLLIDMIDQMGDRLKESGKEE